MTEKNARKTILNPSSEIVTIFGFRYESKQNKISSRPNFRQFFFNYRRMYLHDVVLPPPHLFLYEQTSPSAKST